jgi:hypothetical protein
MTKMLLNRSRTWQAYNIGKTRFDRYKDFDKANYQNTLAGHVVGALGEIATFLWLDHAMYDPVANFILHDSDADIFSRLLQEGFEVKTWRENDWPSLGHSISESQYKTVVRKAKRIIWCSVSWIKDISPATACLGCMNVELMGWNYTSDFKDVLPKTFPQNGKQSRQIDIMLIRPMEKL